MEWTDEAIMLSARPHGENAAVAVVLSAEHGRHAGLVHGGLSARLRPVLQPGTQVRAEWKARLAEQLGIFTLEALHAFGAEVMDDALRLGALAAACAVAEAALPEREPHPAVYHGLLALFAALPGPAFAEAYIGWEIGLLAALGFGIDVTRCAATGTNDNLAYISPRTGRAVSLSAGEPYRDRLLPLPRFLLGQGAGGPDEVMQGLALTGHFLERHVFTRDPLGQGKPPPARLRFVERYGNLHRVAGIVLPPA